MSKRDLTRYALGLAVSACACSGGAARAGDAPDSCGAWPFGFNRIVALDSERELLFESAGGAVVIHDVSRPETPAFQSDTIRTGGVVSDLFYEPSSQRLYIAAGEGGLEVWGITDPVNPVRLGQLDLFHFIVPTIRVPVHGVVARNGVAYAAADIGGVQSVDVSDPANMVSFAATLGGVNFTTLNLVSAQHVIYAEGHVFASGNDFVKFEIEPDGSLDAVQGVSLRGRPFVSDNVAYLVYSGNLLMVDAVGNDPAINPILPILGLYATTPNVRDVFVEGNTGYVVDPFAGLAVLDVTNPANVLEIGSLSSAAAQRLVVSDLIAYTTGPGGRLVSVADVDDLFAISEIPASGSSAYGVAGEGQYAYLANANLGLTVVDVEDPAAAEMVTSVSTPDIALDVQVVGDFAFVACREAGLRIFDIQSPTDPVEIGSADIFDYARRVFVQGDYAFGCDLQLGVRVIDVADPTNPSQAAFIATPAWVHATHAVGNRLYVAGDTAGLLIFDITDPQNPTAMGSLNTPNFASGVDVVGDFAYVGDFGGGLRVIDVSDPFAPSEVGAYNPGGFIAYQVSVRDGIAYVVDSGEGVSLIDVSTPSSPFEIDFIDTPGSAFDLSLSGDRLYVADGETGLRIFGDCEQAVPGDVNGDGVVDLADVAMFATCLTGPGGMVSPECALADIDDDADADVADFAHIQAGIPQ